MDRLKIRTQNDEMDRDDMGIRSRETDQERHEKDHDVPGRSTVSSLVFTA